MTAGESADAASYARFAKRDLDKMSWLGPLVDNRFGDLLNIELRHEQLFFIQGERVLEDIGYSEKGKRFSEAEYGKPIRSLEDIKKYGYWFVGPEYDPEVMREALARQQDGYYYSFFSNQCQDWADRLKRGARRIERERGIAHSGLKPHGHAIGLERRVLPTEPASIWMGLVALALGIGGFVAPVIAGSAFTAFLGAFFLAAGVSHTVYGLHAKDWNNLLHELLTSLINVAAGALILWNREFARMSAGAIIAAALALHGAINVFLGAFSKPRSHWIGKLIAGCIMFMAAVLVATRWPISGARALGIAVGVSLLAGGLSTIVLSWKTRRERA